MRLLRTLLILLALALALNARADDVTEPTDGAGERILREIKAWDIEAAAKLVKQLQATAPDDRGTKYLAGRVAFEQGDYDRAVSLLSEALGDGAERSEDYRLAVGAQKENAGSVVEESAHFTIRYKPGKDAALVPYAMESMEAAYAALTKDLGYEPEGKIRIEFYGTPRALARVSSLSEQAIKTTGTIALCKYNRLLVTSPRALVRGYEWQDTIAHEFVHYLVTHKTRDSVPIWLHEGIAKYLETRWRGPAGQALDGGQEALLARAVKTGKFVTFEQMYPSIALLPSQEEAALAYAEVFTFIQYVDQKLGMAGVRAILDALKAGKSDREAVSAALGQPFDRVEAAWRTQLKSRPVPKLAPGIEKLVFKDDAAKKDPKAEREKSYDRGELGTLPTPEARKFAHLGELMRARNRLVSAALEYEKALKSGGRTHPALTRKYALTMIALGHNDEAEKELQATLAMYPDDETNHLLYGRLLLAKGKAAEAKGHFLLANQRDPFDDEIHAGLVAVAKVTNDPGLQARETDVLTILAGRKLTWHAAEPGTVAAQSYLRIEAPLGAKVLVDGVDTGLTTPVAEHPLPSGRHVIRLEPAGAAPIEKALDFPADEITPFIP